MKKEYLFELELLRLYHNLELHVGVTTVFVNKPESVCARLTIV